MRITKKFISYFLNNSAMFCALWRNVSPKSFSRHMYRRIATNKTVCEKWNYSRPTCKNSKLDMVADVITIPVLNDNYSYLVVDRKTKKGMCVDPVEPCKIIKVAEQRNVELRLAICTHKHSDHSGGNVELLKMVADMEIIGSAYEEIPGVTKRMMNKETYEFGSLTITAFHTPCHTLGHELFYITDRSNIEGKPLLFTGDTLFVGGCGRFFEGSAQQMLRAMSLIKELPDETQIFCGHEYTVKNLEFALTIDKFNPDLRQAYEVACTKHAQKIPTVPSSVLQEKKINPFMRVSEIGIRENLPGGQDLSDEEVMSLLRRMKNNF